MGTIDSKIKNGYTLNKKSFLGLKTKEGVKPNLIKSTFKKFYSMTKDFGKNKTSQHDQSEISVVSNLAVKKPEVPESQRVQQNSEYPYSSIGLISCQLGDHKVIGSGCLIGPNYVLTCAHNVYSFNDKKIGKNITFTPMFNSSRENTTYVARKVHLSQELLLANLSADEILLFDYVVIELQCENIEQNFGTLGLQANFKPQQNQPLNIIGNNFHARNAALQKLTGTITEENNLFKYDIPTGYGMNGAPIIRNIDGVSQVVGIHLYCRHRNGQLKSGGIKLNSQILQNIQKWCLCQQEEIDLREKLIGKQGIKQISKHKWNNLVSLNISRNGIQSNSAKYLKRGHWKNLVYFDLGGNLIGMEGARALAQSELSAIVTLNLWGNCIGKGGAYSISMANWENLTNLNLYNNQISDQGVEYLSQANWKNLNNLNLGKNEITIHGARFILEGKWPKLTSLNLWGNDLSCQETLLKSHLLQKFCVLKFLYL